MEVRDAGCPLGAECERVKVEDGKDVLFRCPWYKMFRGLHPNTGEQVDEWGCAIGWAPVLQMETAKHVRGTQKATEELKNELVKRIDRAKAAVAFQTRPLIESVSNEDAER